MHQWRQLLQLTLVPSLINRINLQMNGNMNDDSKHQAALNDFISLKDQTLFAHLTPDPQTDANKPNKKSRQVISGHYVRVLPTPLPNPALVAVSASMAKSLSLSETDIQSNLFLHFFSGKQESLPSFQSWATPYALSIYGSEMYKNCPFGNGNGYGDGRAISIAEIHHPVTGRWECQLKGAGTTPFCRGGDGRAVLRSSVREFLASEAMFHLGVSTTRALSLVVSQSETVKRAWYSSTTAPSPNLNDPRYAHVPAEMRSQLIAYLISQARDPDVMQSEKCAITCRVAKSFLRVGQVELFGRRMRQNKTASAQKELEDIIKHLLFKEYPELGDSAHLQTSALQLLRSFSQRICIMTADWLRVGYVQGNFNSDNCLAGGRTMDYGPFGFMERFEQRWNMWSGGGEHFSFINQPTAGTKNFESFAMAVMEVMDDVGKKEARKIIDENVKNADMAVQNMWCKKLGFKPVYQESKNPEPLIPEKFELIQGVLGLMEETQVDYTIFWRQLSTIG